MMMMIDDDDEDEDADEEDDDDDEQDVKLKMTMMPLICWLNWRPHLPSLELNLLPSNHKSSA